jgi:hypothetical protein
VLFRILVVGLRVGSRSRVPADLGAVLIAFNVAAPSSDEVLRRWLMVVADPVLPGPSAWPKVVDAVVDPSDILLRVLSMRLLVAAPSA